MNTDEFFLIRVHLRSSVANSFPILQNVQSRLDRAAHLVGAFDVVYIHALRVARIANRIREESCRDEIPFDVGLAEKIEQLLRLLEMRAVFDQRDCGGDQQRLIGNDAFDFLPSFFALLMSSLSLMPTIRFPALTWSTTTEFPPNSFTSFALTAS
jgi:hypothetical protein